MGVDISGKKPNNETGEYFQSNWWGWRPILMLCELANEKYKLRMNFNYWGSNDGKGLRTEKQCIRLADALDKLIKTDELNEDSDRLYLCMGAWVDDKGRFVGSDVELILNTDYHYGTIIYNGIVTENGTICYPAHSASKKHITNFIAFLRECGGFEIW
jgi:hypothetical protein